MPVTTPSPDSASYDNPECLQTLPASLWGPKWPALKSHFPGHVFAFLPVACSAARQLWRCCVGCYRHRTPWALHLQNEVNRDWKGSWLLAFFRTDPTKNQLSEIDRQGENGEASSKNTENNSKNPYVYLVNCFTALGHGLVFMGRELGFHRDPKCAPDQLGGGTLVSRFPYFCVSKN